MCMILTNKNFFCYTIISGGAKMSERDLDSSINDYIETETTKNYVRQQEWNMAIGLQDVKVNIKMQKKLKIKMQFFCNQIYIVSDDSESIFNLFFKRYELPLIFIICE